MAPKNKMAPIHPGEILADELDELEMTPDQMDKCLAVPTGTVSAILAHERGIDADFALRISRYLGAGERLWMNLQVSYDLKVAEEKVGPQILKEVTPRPDIIEIPGEWEQA